MLHPQLQHLACRKCTGEVHVLSDLRRQLTHSYGDAEPRPARPAPNRAARSPEATPEATPEMEPEGCPFLGRGPLDDRADSS